MQYLSIIVFVFSFFSNSLFAQYSKPETDYSKYIDPFIGMQGDGNTFPGVSYPFGMVKLRPDCDNLNSNMGPKPTGWGSKILPPLRCESK